MMRRTLVATAAAVSVVGLLLAGTSAGGAVPAQPSAGSAFAPRVGSQVVVGQTGTPAPCGVAGTAWVQYATAAAPTYAVPGPGVITSFSHNANATAGSIRALVVGPGTAPNNRTVLGHSAPLVVTPSTLNTFAVRLPVPAGAGLGIHISADEHELPLRHRRGR